MHVAHSKPLSHFEVQINFLRDFTKLILLTVIYFKRTRNKLFNQMNVGDHISDNLGGKIMSLGYLHV